MKRYTAIGAMAFALGCLGFLGSRSSAQDMIEMPAKSLSVQERDNYSTYRIDLNALDNDKRVELLVSPNESFSVVTISTNRATGTFSGDTMITFVDSWTNVIGKVEIPKNGARGVPFNAMPATR